MPSIRMEIRLLKDPDEYRQCERLQRHAWGTLDVGAGVLTAMQKAGGVVIGTIVNG